MSANIFQTLFDVSIPDKVNGIADNDNLIGGVDPKVENANGTKAAPSNPNKPAPNVPAVAVEPAPAPALNGPTTNVPAAAKEFPPNAKPANEPAVGVPVLPANENVPVPTNAKSVSSPEPELKIVPICETNQILKRAVIIIFIFCLATYLAAITLAVRPILEFVLGPDINLSINNNDNYTKKWFSIAKLILIYIAFIIAYVIGIILVITCIVMIFMVFTGTDTVIDDTMITMLFYLWQFEEKSSIWYIYVVLIAVIFIAVILFLYYHLYIKSYLENLSYPNMAETGKEEFSTPTKFIFYFGLYLSMLYLLYLFVLTNALPGGNFASICFYIYIIVCIFILFLCIIYKYTLNRSNIEIPIATWFIFALSIFLCAILWERVPQIEMKFWMWLILSAVVTTYIILISILIIIISGLIMIIVIGLLIFLFASTEKELN